MHFFEYYTKNFVKYDLLNKFQYKKISQIPKLNKIILSYEFKKYDFRLLLSALIALELITLQKCSIIRAKVSNISLKVRKGNPIGCKVILRKKLMNLFFFKLLNELLIKIQKFNLNFDKKESKTFSFKVKNSLIFTELENNYQFFKNLPGLNIIIITNATNYNDLKLLLKLYKIISN